MPPRDPSQDDLDELEAVDVSALRAAMMALAAKIARSQSTSGAMTTIAGWMAGYIGLAWMKGAFRTLKEVDAFPSADRPPAGTLDPPSGVGVRPRAITFPDETPLRFKEAIRDLLSRNPRLATNAAEVSNVMRSGGFAAAQSTKVSTTRQVIQAITRMEKAGMSTSDAATVVRGITGWSQAYADTVVRTTASTSYSMGRFEQARRLGAHVAMAFEIMGPDDSIARKNHVAAIGFLAAVNDPAWVEFMPPLGYQCRHTVAIVPRSVLARRGLLDEEGRVITFKPPGFSGAHRDPGFSNVVWRFTG